MEDRQHIYKELLEICKSRGLTRYEIAKQLSVTPSTVYAWDKVAPKYERLHKIANMLGLELVLQLK